MVKADKAVTGNALVCLGANLTEVSRSLPSSFSCLLRQSERLGILPLIPKATSSTLSPELTVLT
jgi:hypothetical protein